MTIPTLWTVEPPAFPRSREGHAEAEITATPRKNLNLAGPPDSGSWGGSSVAQAGVRALPVEDALGRAQPGHVSSVISITVDPKEGRGGL